MCLQGLVVRESSNFPRTGSQQGLRKTFCSISSGKTTRVAKTRVPEGNLWLKMCGSPWAHKTPQAAEVPGCTKESWQFLKGLDTGGRWAECPHKDNLSAVGAQPWSLSPGLKGACRTFFLSRWWPCRPSQWWPLDPYSLPCLCRCSDFENSTWFFSREEAFLWGHMPAPILGELAGKARSNSLLNPEVTLGGCSGGRG